MSTTRNNPNTPPRSSITALSVASAFVRSAKLSGQINKLIPKRDIDLADHIVNKAASLQENYLLWGTAKGLLTLPLSMQHLFFNKAAFSAYDQHMLVRKLLIADKIKKAIEEGAGHIIFLGGGYDARPLLSAMDYPHVYFYELDRGQTRQNKLAALKSIPPHLGLHPISVTEADSHTTILNKNLFCLECDFLEDDLLKILDLHPDGKKMLFIAEGLTMYLKQKDINKLMEKMGSLLKEKDEILLSFIPHTNMTYITSLVLQSTQEEYNFSLSPDQVFQFVGQYGLDVKSKIFSENMLEWIGDIEDSNALKRDPTKPRENYFLLTHSAENIEILQKKDINLVPTYPLGLPPKIEKDAFSSNLCTLI